MPRKHPAAGDLVIVESPGMAKTIERTPCPGRAFMAGHGHVDAPAKGF
jgi:hypothetical protein